MGMFVNGRKMINNPNKILLQIDRLLDLLNYPKADDKIQTDLMGVAAVLTGVAFTYGDYPNEG